MELTETRDRMPWPPVEGPANRHIPNGLQLAFLAAFCAAASLPATAAPPQSPRPAMAAPKASAMEAGKSGGSDIPSTFTVPTTGYDYVKREVMIPMRDGVKLYTVIVVPKGAKSAPMLLTRTPYDASKRAARNESPHMLAEMPQADEVFVADGYIRVFQDVRGKYKSQGEYVMTRPVRGPLNPTTTDHATDAYDTIDWLVKNTPESNGRVGMIGSSYEGFTVVMALLEPHPALKVAAPESPMVDGWMGDDWFHNGAFREQGMPYIYEQEATRRSDVKWWKSYFDDYDMFMQAGSAGELGRLHGLEQVGCWRKILEHPSYDAYWRDQAVDRLLAAEPLKVPVMLVDSL